MSDMDFTFKGVSASSLGVVVTSLPPITKALKRDEPQPVPGRHGSLHVQDGAYEEILLMISGYLPYEQGVTVAPMEKIKAWLNGNGLLTLSDVPDRAYYARVLDAVSYSPFVVGFSDRVFQVGFWCDPLAREVEEETITLYRAQSIDNPGTETALPKIEVTGTGDILIAVGDIYVQLSGLNGTAVIDSEIKSVYVQGGGAGGVTLIDRAFPVLPVGETNISWTGNVTSVQVTPRWRWL